jgi:hypothetical protein
MESLAAKATVASAAFMVGHLASELNPSSSEQNYCPILCISPLQVEKIMQKNLSYLSLLSTKLESVKLCNFSAIALNQNAPTVLMGLYAEVFAKTKRLRTFPNFRKHFSQKVEKFTQIIKKM